MIDLGQTEFRFAVPSLDAAALESVSNRLFDDWEDYVRRSVILSDYSLFLQIDEGSINGWGRVKSTAKVLLVGVSTYGGVHYGIETIGRQLGATRTFLAEQAMSAFACPKEKATLRKESGAPGYLQRLFSRVQRGEMTADEATVLAERMLAEGGDDTPDLIGALREAFRKCPRQHEQVPLPLPDSEDLLDVAEAAKRHPKPRTPKAPDLPPPLQYRVEVWRESRKTQKKSKVSPL